MEGEKIMDLNSLGLELDVLESNPNNLMLNELVLQNLFNIVPLQDLKIYRSVCNLWWELSLPFVRSNSRISIEGPRGETTHKYEDYLELISSTEDDKLGFLLYPFEDFYFGWGNEGGKVLEFCARFGSQIKRLNIGGCSFRRADFRKIIFELLPNLKSFACQSNTWNEFDNEEGGVSAFSAQPVKTMKSLHLNLGSLDRDRSFQFPFSWLEMFQLYPALTALELHDIERISRLAEFEKLILAMKTVSENTGTKWKIEKLDIRRIGIDYGTDAFYTPFTPAVLRYLRQLQFPLRSLYFDVSGHNEAVSEFVDMYSAALQELTMYSPASHFVFLNTISFDYLSKLHLIGNVPNLHFLRSTPNLKTLWIEDGSEYICEPFQSVGMMVYLREPWNEFARYETVSTIRNTNFAELDGFVLHSLEELVLERELCSSDDLWALLKLMPNLTRLGIGLDSDGFRLVCNNLKGLTALDIKPSRVDQHTITGTMLGLNVHLPNITELKSLRFFGIGKPLTSAAMLSEDAVKNGLLQLSSLDDISVYCSPNMSEETFTQLREKFPKSFIRKFNENPDPEEEEE